MKSIGMRKDLIDLRYKIVTLCNQVFLPIAPESNLFWAVGLLSPPAFAMGIDQVFTIKT